MQSWSARRRFIYGGSVFLVLVIIVLILFFKFFYKAPTCFDRIKNGDEQGIDCGGSCVNLCTSDALTPITLWSKIFNISGDVYTAVAFVENPNINSKNAKATYQFRIFDDKNTLITVIDGQTSIPKNKKFAIFETGLVLRGNTPKSADFRFIDFSVWEQDLREEPDLLITHSNLINPTTSPRITGTITNQSLFSIPEIELAVLVLDSNENVVAASRSFVDNLYQKTSQNFVFTWPKAFDLGVEACVNPLDVALLLDKSGSMKSESANPPEPFNTVISTAKDFINNLNDTDQASIISFGNGANLEMSLSLNKQGISDAIRNLSLGDSSEQTNITAGLDEALKELSSGRQRSDSKKAVILLTDGIPTEPKDPNLADNPAISAQAKAQDIKNRGIDIYTIGLGSNIGEGFLRTISTDNNHYFFAPTKENLSSIYTKIGSSLCPRKPNVITVIYRTL